MTPKQRELARRALGLPNSRNISYRNRFTAAYVPGGNYDIWDAMSDAGLAEKASAMVFNCYRFWLTPEGAKAALNEGERLCPDDFPEDSRGAAE